MERINPTRPIGLPDRLLIHHTATPTGRDIRTPEAERTDFNRTFFGVFLELAKLRGYTPDHIARVVSNW